MQLKNDDISKCPGCGESFILRGFNHIYCSRSCRIDHISVRQAWTYYTKCIVCGEWFDTYYKKAAYCSTECKSANHRTRNDLLSLVNLEYYFEKYNWTCLLCGEHGSPSELACHHVIPVALGGKTTEDNIAVLCHRCHVSQHTSDIWSMIRKDNSCAWGLLLKSKNNTDTK
jgi:hypothetical protein